MSRGGANVVAASPFVMESPGSRAEESPFVTGGADEVVMGAGEVVRGAGEVVRGAGEVVVGVGEVVIGVGEVKIGVGEVVMSVDKVWRGAEVSPFVTGGAVEGLRGVEKAAISPLEASGSGGGTTEIGNTEVTSSSISKEKILLASKG